MKMKGVDSMVICGIEHCRFVNKDNQEVKFERISLLRDIDPAKGTGQAAEVVNVSVEKSAGLEVGDNVEIFYNRFGKVAMIDIVDR